MYKGGQLGIGNDECSLEKDRRKNSAQPTEQLQSLVTSLLCPYCNLHISGYIISYMAMLWQQLLKLRHFLQYCMHLAE